MLFVCSTVVSCDAKNECPVCGLEPLSDQKFCRKCGASLGIDTQPLAGLAAVTTSEPKALIVREGATSLARMVVRTGFIIMFAGVVLGIIGKKLFNIDIVSVVGVLLSVAGMFMIAYPFIFPSPRRRQDAVPRQQPGSMKPADPTKKLTPMNDIDFISASVTEGTTDLLKTPTTTSPDI